MVAIIRFLIFCLLFGMALGILIAFSQINPDRLEIFLPSLAVIGTIGLCTKVTLEILGHLYRKRLDDPAWLKQHEVFSVLVWTIPGSLMEAPFLEEFVFRSALILFFPAVTGNAWIGILVSGTLFGAAHLTNHLGVPSEGTDGDKVVRPKGPGPWTRGIIQCCIATVLGCLCGWLGITFQSLWVSVLVHCLWNLIPTGFGIVVMLLFRHYIEDYLKEELG